MAKAITIVPKAKGTVKAGLLTGTAKVATTPTIDTALCNHLRLAYGNTYYADETNDTGDAVSTLADEYLMKIVKDVQALQPATPITTHNVYAGADANGVIHPVMVAMKAAETAGKVSETADVTVAGIRSSAAKVALVLSGDKEFDALIGCVVDAERTRKQTPGKLAFTLRRLFVTPTCNMIQGSGPDFDNNAFWPWPEIGTKESTEPGKHVNNPELEKKEVAGGKMGLVSWYMEVVRMLPRGKALYERKIEYRKAADGDAPSGPYSDQASALYLDPIAAQKKVEEIESDMGHMMKAIKRATEVLRQMWAVDEMSLPGQPPRCKAEFQMERKWDIATRNWVVDESALQGTDSPIIVTDTINGERAVFGIGEFMAHDADAAGKVGGTLQDFRKAVSKKKRAPGSGTGATGAAGAAAAPVVALTMEGTANHIAALATTAESPIPWANFQRYLSTEDHNDALLSAYHLASSIMHMLQTKPDFRARIAKLDNTTEAAIAESVGMDREQTKPSAAALNPQRKVG